MQNVVHQFIFRVCLVAVQEEVGQEPECLQELLELHRTILEEASHHSGLHMVSRYGI